MKRLILLSLLAVFLYSCGDSINDFSKFSYTVKDAEGNIVGYFIDMTENPMFHLISPKGYIFYVNPVTGYIEPVETRCTDYNDPNNDDICTEAKSFYYESDDCSGTPYMVDTESSLDIDLSSIENNTVYVKAGVGDYNDTLLSYEITNKLERKDICSYYDPVKQGCTSLSPCITGEYVIPYTSISTEDTGIKTHYPAPLSIDKDTMVKIYNNNEQQVGYLASSFSEYPFGIIMSDKDYFARTSFDTGSILQTGFYYTEADCKGTPYLNATFKEEAGYKDTQLKEFYDEAVISIYPIEFDGKLYISSGDIEYKSILSKKDSGESCYNYSSARDYSVSKAIEISEDSSGIKIKYNVPFKYEK